MTSPRRPGGALDSAAEAARLAPKSGTALAGVLRKGPHHPAGHLASGRSTHSAQRRTHNEAGNGTEGENRDGRGSGSVTVCPKAAPMLENLSSPATAAAAPVAPAKRIALPIAVVAEALSVAIRTVERRIEAGDLKAIRVGSVRRVLASSLEAYIARGGSPPRATPVGTRRARP